MKRPINNIKIIDEEKFPSGFNARIINDTPYIVKLRKLLNTKEIESILKMAEGKFSNSTIVVGDKLTLSNTRTSQTAFITDNGQFKKYNKYMENVITKVCYLVGCRRNQIENIMVVRYGPNDQYYNHWDFFEPEHENMISNGGNRIATFFCYLNTLEADNGGETEFPEIGIKSRPKKGSALFWWNITPDGQVIRETLHRGNPVKGKDVYKYGLNIWIRKDGFK